jgi:hypothetical protein
MISLFSQLSEPLPKPKEKKFVKSKSQGRFFTIESGSERNVSDSVKSGSTVTASFKKSLVNAYCTGTSTSNDDLLVMIAEYVYLTSCLLCIE